MQNMNPKTSRLKLALVFVAIVLVVWIAFRTVTAFTFHVVSTNPKTNQVSNAVPFFDINFNKTLLSTSVFLTSSPNIISTYTVTGKAIDISLKPLTVNTRYTITVKSVSSTNHNVLSNKVISFTTKSISPSDLPEDQQQAILRKQADYSTPADNPITAYLPYSTLDFILNPFVTTDASGKSALILQAQILLGPGVSGAAAATETAQYEQEVVDYIRSLGFNPSNYTIQYQVVNESLSGT
jgi:hypothetical protein